MQLSWPREGNKRRAMVGHDSKTLAKLSRKYRGRSIMFLNVSSADVALSDALQEKLNLGKQCDDSNWCTAPNTPLII